MNYTSNKKGSTSKGGGRPNRSSDIQQHNGQEQYEPNLESLKLSDPIGQDSRALHWSLGLYARIPRPRDHEAKCLQGGMVMACQGFNTSLAQGSITSSKLYLILGLAQLISREKKCKIFTIFWSICFPNIFRGDYDRNRPPIGRLLIHPKLTHYTCLGLV